MRVPLSETEVVKADDVDEEAEAAEEDGEEEEDEEGDDTEAAEADKDASQVGQFIELCVIL